MKFNFVLLGCPALAAYFRPAEWGAQSSVIMAWPSADNPAYTDAQDDLEAATSDITNIAQAVAKFEPVKLLVVQSRLADAKSKFGDSKNITLHPIETYPKLDLWMRDMTIDDVQCRIADQVKDLHLDERLAQGRELLGRNLAAGREKASSMFSKLYNDMEYLRESQRRRADDAAAARASVLSDKSSGAAGSSGTTPSVASPTFAVDMTKAQATMQSVGNKAGAYMSSWASWAGEKRKNSNWTANWRNSKSQPKHGGSSTPTSPIDKDYQMISTPGSRGTSTDGSHAHSRGSATSATMRPLTQQSFSESILSRASSSFDRPLTGESSVDKDDALGVTALSSEASDASSTPAIEKIKSPAVATSTKHDGFRTEELVGSKSASQKSTETPPTPVAPSPTPAVVRAPDANLAEQDSDAERFEDAKTEV